MAKAKRNRHSLIPKISLVLIGTAISLFVVTVVGYKSVARKFERQEVFEKHIEAYLSYMAQDIGYPPDLAKIRKIEQDLNLSLMVKAPDGVVIGSPLPSPDLMKPTHFSGGHPDRSFRLHEKNVYFFHQQNGYDYVLKLSHAANLQDIDWKDFVPLLIVMGLILVAAFLMLRRMMRPVTTLKAGTEAFGRGQLAHRIQINTRDEFALLAESFNSMADRLQKLITGKEQLLLDISHEIRSPLTRIRLALEMAPEYSAKSGAIDDVQELEHLTGNLLRSYRDILQPEAVELTQIRLKEIVDSVISAFGAGDRIRCAVTDDQASDIVVRANAETARTVIRNIIDNALKYSEGAEHPVEITFERRHDEFDLKVRDYGIGVTEEELDRITEPFYRTDKSRQRKTGGFGLGLSLAARLMKDQNGRISFSQPDGPGLVVILTFKL